MLCGMAKKQKSEPKKNPQKYLKLKKKTKSLFKVTTAKLQDKKPFETTTGLSNKGHS